MASSRPDSISIFPLPLVLLPGERLPLHIFEERYKRLIARTRETGEPFGIVLQVGDGVAAVGCLARLVGVLEELPDGPLNIVVQGEEAFRLVEVQVPTDPEAETLAGSVEFLRDEDSEVAEEAVREAEGLLTRIRALSEAHTVESIEPDLVGQADPSEEFGEGAEPKARDATALAPDAGSPASYQLAAGVEVETALKQRLLQMREESKRLDLLIDYLKTFANRLELLVERKDAIRGNGKAT
jgi:Lon protease-like protein